MLETIFSVEIFVLLIIAILAYQTSTEWLHRIAGLGIMMVIPVALVEYKMYKGSSGAIEQYSLLYSILVDIVATTFGFGTNIVASMNRVSSSRLLSHGFIVCVGAAIITIHICFNNKFDIIKLSNGLCVYDVHQLGNKYLLDHLFGIFLSVRLTYVARKIYQKNTFSSKKRLDKGYFVLHLIFSVCLFAHLFMVLNGFHMPVGYSFLFLPECIGLLWFYKMGQLIDPRLTTRVISALEDIFQNYIVLDKNFIIIDMNKICEETLEITHDDVVNQSIFKLLQANFLINENELSIDEIQDCIENGKQLNVHDKTQSLFLHITSAACFSANNKKIGYLLYLEDVTLSEKNKQLFEATQQLKKQMLINEHFANTISHDIKTPVIEMENTIAHAKLDTIHQYQLCFDNIKYSLQELKHYINQSFDYSLKTNFYETSTPIKSQQLFSQMKILFNYILLERNIQFVIKGEILLQQNKLLLEQVFINLINNTLKYNKNHEDLLIEISVKTDQRKNIICYSDNGVGISSDKKESIFKSLSSTQLTANSTNIGLPMCKKIIEMMNGTIVEKGILNNGAVFLIELPILNFN